MKTSTMAVRHVTRPSTFTMDSSYLSFYRVPLRHRSVTDALCFVVDIAVAVPKFAPRLLLTDVFYKSRIGCNLPLIELSCVCIPGTVPQIFNQYLLISARICYLLVVNLQTAAMRAPAPQHRSKNWGIPWLKPYYEDCEKLWNIFGWWTY